MIFDIWVDFSYQKYVILAFYIIKQPQIEF
jgi:hypothetical protein